MEKRDELRIIMCAFSAHILMVMASPATTGTESLEGQGSGADVFILSL